MNSIFFIAMTFCPTDLPTDMPTRDILLQRFSYIISYLIRLQIIAHKKSPCKSIGS